MADTPARHSAEYVSLKEYFDRLIAEMDRRQDERMKDLDKRYHERFHANDVALEKADKLLAEYKIQANDWRKTLADERERMLSKSEYLSFHRELKGIVEVDSGRIAALELDRSGTMAERIAAEKSADAALRRTAIIVSAILGISGMIATAIWHSR